MRCEVSAGTAQKYGDLAMNEGEGGKRRHLRLLTNRRTRRTAELLLPLKGERRISALGSDDENYRNTSKRRISVSYAIASHHAVQLLRD
jgi:hypothetical protein